MSESVKDDLTFTNHDDGLIISPVKASSNDTLNTLRLEMVNMFSQSFDNLMVKMATVIETKLDDRFDSTVGNWNSKLDSKLSPILQRLGNIDSKVDAMEAQKSAEALNISENFPMQVLDRNQPRRESVFFGFEEEHNKVHSPSSNNPEKQYLATEVKISKSDMLTELTPEEYLRVVQAFHTHRNSTHDKSKKLVHFFHTKELNQLVDNERRLGNPGCSLLTYGRIFDSSDNDIERYVANFFRPLSCADYRERMLNSVTKIEAYAEDRIGDFYVIQVKDFDTKLHPKFSKGIMEFREFYTIFRLGAKVEELALQPKDNFGKKNHPGVFRIGLEIFGPYEESITSYVGEDNIKNCKSVDEFVTFLKDAINELCTDAKNLRATENRLRPYELLLNSSKHNKSSRVINEPSKHRSNNKFGSREHQYKQPYQSLKLLSSDVRKLDRKDEEEEASISSEGSCEFSMNYEDDQGSVQSMERQTQDHADHSNNIVIKVDDAEEIEFLLAMNGFQKTQDKNASKPSFTRPSHSKAPNIDKKQMPCFALFKDGVCPNKSDCGYSHEYEVLFQYGEDKKKQFMNNHFIRNNPKLSILKRMAGNEKI